MHIIRSDKNEKMKYFRQLFIFLCSFKFVTFNDSIDLNNFPYFISDNEIFSLISNKTYTLNNRIGMLSFFYENDIELKNEIDEYVDKIY